jgi:uncharacterized protein (TIGR00375 family)
MRIIADLHLHSKYSRATSKQMDVEHLYSAALRKGIGLMATGDFTHPQYLKELREKLVEDGTGLLKLRDSSPVSHGTQNDNAPRFILSGEISCIYRHKEKTRRLHILILVPNFDAVDRLNAELVKRGCNLKSDGRPIIGLSAKELLKICLSVDERIMVIPAHAWTPWFAIFGSKSGYDSIEECFEELSPNIFAIETGLSSDPAMNWRLSALDGVSFISNSDAHSPDNVGREANVFDLPSLTYDELRDALKNKNSKKFLSTVEFFPEEGMYHWDGHSKCKFSCAPADSLKMKNICPVCKKEMTLGVEHRVEKLADRSVGFVPAGAVPFVSLIPLREIIAECLGRQKKTKGVEAIYEKMIAARGELEILMSAPFEEIKKIADANIAEAIARMRDGKVYRKPGFDGEYGIISVFSPEEKEKMKQGKMF